MASLASSSHKHAIYSLIALTVVSIGLGIFVSRGNIRESPQEAAPPPTASSPLSATQPAYTFGFVSMAAGNVSHRYAIRNGGTSAVTVTKIYTSCMCTTATLVTPRGSKGPFGMPGHGPDASVAERIGPGEEAVVEVVFDPRAHGPSGLGLNERNVTLQSDAGPPLKLHFTAMVRP